MVDDAHSLGVLADGHGTAAHFGLTDEVDLIMGTFSKSFASIGGFIAGDEQTIHYIQHFARSFAFSASLPASNAAAVLAALDIIESEPEHVQRLWDNAEYMRAGLKQLGYDTGHQQHAGHPAHDPRRLPDGVGVARADRRRRVYQSGRIAGRPAERACCGPATWRRTPKSILIARCAGWKRSGTTWI